MIVDFKIFEKKTIPICYWKVPTGSKLKIALKKIGMDTENIEFWNHLFDSLSDTDDRKYIFMIKNNDNNFWNWHDCDIPLHAIRNHERYKYMGEVKITEMEVDADKYNL